MIYPFFSNRKNLVIYFLQLIFNLIRQYCTVYGKHKHVTIVIAPLTTVKNNFKSIKDKELIFFTNYKTILFKLLNFQERLYILLHMRTT